MTAEEACSWGLVNKVVPGDQLMSEVMALAQTFAAGPTKAYGAAKHLLHSAFAESMETQLESESRSIVNMISTRDGCHGLESFLNKRKREFKGE